MNFTGLIAVGVGAAVGAWLRWGLSIALAGSSIGFSLGTLAANLVGGLLMGVAVGAFAHGFIENQEMRLLITTGFLGGLTTFSTFSAEAVALIERKQLDMVFLHMSAHVVGSIVMTLVGVRLSYLLLK